MLVERSVASPRVLQRVGPQRRRCRAGGPGGAYTVDVSEPTRRITGYGSYLKAQGAWISLETRRCVSGSLHRCPTIVGPVLSVRPVCLSAESPAARRAVARAAAADRAEGAARAHGAESVLVGGAAHAEQLRFRRSRPCTRLGLCAGRVATSEE